MKFIVFEGLDGSGKSSLIQSLKSELDSHKIQWMQTREPGGTPLGEEIRTLITRHSEPPPSPRTELLLYEASRSQHVDLVIRPALKNKVWVLCDRFTASSVAFQGGGRSISREDVMSLNHFATGGLVPDLTVLVDLSVEESKKRRAHREKSTGESADRIEAENDDFHQRVRDSFLLQSQENAATWLVLDSRKTPAELKQLLIDHLKGLGWLG